MKRGSSTRLMRAPRTSVVILVASPSRVRGGGGGALSHDRRGLADRGDDVVVPGAAADVAFDGVPDLVIGGVGRVVEEVCRGHDHPRGTEPALQAVLVPERLLERMEGPVGRHALDGGDAVAVGLDRQDRAALHSVPVEVDGARPALAGIAADMRTRKSEVLPERLDEESTGLDIELSSDAIDLERDVPFGHPDLLPPVRIAGTPWRGRCDG